MSESLRKRNFKSVVLIDEFISFENERKVLQTDYESKLSKSNSISKTIGQLFKDGKKDETVILKEESLKIKQETKLLSEKLNDVKTKIDNILYQIPNVPNKNVPIFTLFMYLLLYLIYLYRRKYARNRL